MKFSMDNKTCSKCNKEMSINCFPKSSTGKYGVHSWCKNCHREYGYSHKKERSEASKRYRENHPEKAREYVKRAYENKKSEKLEYAKQYRTKNKEVVLTRTKKWIASNIKKYKEAQRSWVNNHKDKLVQYKQNRRFRIMGNGGKYSTDEWISLCKKFGNKCICCGKSNVILTVDHIIPLVKGGMNTIDNLQPLCKSCNSKKGTKIIDFRAVYQGA